MNWETAKDNLRAGYRITRPNWEPNHFWILSQDGYERILCHDGTNASVHLEQTEADDWEIWREEKSLSDEIVKIYKNEIMYVTADIVGVEYIKEFIKKLKEKSVYAVHCSKKEDWGDIVIRVRDLDKLAGPKLC